MTRAKNKLVAFMAVIAVTVLLSSGCGIIEKSPEAIAKEKVAEVGGEVITRGQLNARMAPIKVQMAANNGGTGYLSTDAGKSDLLQQEKAVLQNMIESKLFEQKAKELKLFKDDKEIEDGVTKAKADLVKQYGTEADLNKKLEEQQISQDLLNILLREQVITDKVYEYMFKDVKVTDKEIQDFYDKNKAMITKPASVEASHILVKTEEEAKAVKEKLDKGGDFAALSTEYSTDDVAKKDGGKLGTIQENDPKYDADFVKAAMALSVNQISAPVKTQYGYHIIKVTKKIAAGIMTFEESKDQIKSELEYEAKSKIYTDELTKWKAAASIKYFDKDLKA